MLLFFVDFFFISPLISIVLRRIQSLRYRQDSYRHIIETVPSTTQPSRANQQYPPPNLWTPNEYTSQQQQQQIFMSGIQRPFPGVAATATVQQQGPAIQPTTASTNPLDANLASIDLPAPNQFQNANNFYGSQRIHPSPSGPMGYQAAFGGYISNSFNHHHHHHLSSNDEPSYLIQNPSLT